MSRALVVLLLTLFSAFAHADGFGAGGVTPNGVYFGPHGNTGSIDALFTARIIQGATCVAPCAVQFDARATTDSIYARPFHSLLYLWDFDDPNSGYWSYGALAEAGLPSSKNADQGPITGHVYEHAGVYQPVLGVWNPASDTDTYSVTITVIDPATQFSAANTYCFATDDNDWTGCPLDCTTDDNCTVVDGSPTIGQAFTSGDDCAGGGAAGGDCANAGLSGGKRRILLRRGDTFTMNGTVELLQFNTSPGLIEAFGSGALPHIDASAGSFELGTSWTIAHVHYTRDSGIRMPGIPDFTHSADSRRDGITWFDADVNYGQNWIDSQANDDFCTRFTERVAFIDIRFIGSAPVGEYYGAFMAFDYALLMGVSINHGSPAVVGVGPYATLRTNHLAMSVFAHNSWRGAASGHEHMQIRAWDTMHPSVWGQDVEDNHHNIIRDSLYEEPGNGNGYGDRFCVDSGCNCTGGSAAPGDTCDTDGDTHTGHVVDARDLIYENNLWRCDTRATPNIANRYGALNIEGGDYTIRNNVFDLQNCVNTGIGGYALVGVIGEPQNRASGTSVDGNVQIYNNTIFADHGFGADSVLMTRGTGYQNSGCPDSNCYERNNLWVWPGYAGDTTPNNIAGFTSTNDLFSTSEALFTIGTVPEQSLAQIDDFAIVSNIGGGFPRNAGTNTIGGGTSLVYADILRGRRSSPDIGAMEYGVLDWSGDERHVATTGSDANPGTWDLPFQTLTYAFTQVGPGDTMWVHSGGTFTEAISTDTMAIQGGVGWDNPLLIAGWGSARPLIQPSGTPARAVFLADSGAAYLEFRDLDIDAVNATSEGVKQTWTTNSTNVAHHIRWRRVRVHNMFDGVGGLDRDQGILISDGDYNEFIDMEIDHNGDTANFDHGIYLSTDNNLVMGTAEGLCDIHDNAAAGVEIYDGNTGLDPDDNQVINCDIYANGTAGVSGEGVEMCGARNSVSLSRIHDNQADGVFVYDQVDPGGCESQSISITPNWIYTNGGSSISVSAGAIGTITTPNELNAP